MFPISRRPEAAASLALVNRFAPPDAAPTAAALARLAVLLTARTPALSFQMIATKRTYGGGGAAGENLVRRAVASWRDGRRLAEAASAHAAVLSLTDPPLLASHLARCLPSETLWLEWVMDLHPAALWAALGVRPRRLFSGWSSERRPDLRLFLGPGQAAFAAGVEKSDSPHLILPAGLCERPARPAAPPLANQPVRLAYAGNLGRAHWDDALPLLAAAADPQRFRLTVAAYGARAAAIRRRLAGFPHVEWRDRPLEQAEFDAAHVHVVSLKENWTHVCAPSKAVSALCRGRPVLFFGAAASDVWGWAMDAGLRLDPNRAAAIRGLPGVLAHLAAPDSLAELTRGAGMAGERLRAAEAAAVDALAALLAERLRVAATG